MSKIQKTENSLKKWENEGGSLAPMADSKSEGISPSSTEKCIMDGRSIPGLGDATRHPVHFSQAMLTRLLNSKGEYS